MGDLMISRVWLMRALYLWLALIILFLELLPLQTVPGRWISADILVALTFAWVMRRPDYIPAIAVGAMGLLADLMLQRPPGLMAALLVLAAHTLDRRARGVRELPFLVEWLTVAGAMLALTLLYRLALAIFILPAPPLGLMLVQTAITIALYPLVVLASQVLFGVRRPAPGEIDAAGHML